MSGVSSEMKSAFFKELSRYSMKELVRYFTEGIVAIEVPLDSGNVRLPVYVDNRRELVHNYLFTKPEEFQTQFRGCLDDLLSSDFDPEAEEMFV